MITKPEDFHLQVGDIVHHAKRNWKIEISITTDESLSKEEIVSILQSEIDHSEIDYLFVSRIKEDVDNKFLRGFSFTWENFRWWVKHLDSRPSFWQDNKFFWNILCS